MGRWMNSKMEGRSDGTRERGKEFSEEILMEERN